MTDVIKGFRDHHFAFLGERDGRDLLRLMARVAEQAYRRGAQQGAGLAHRSSFRADLGEWRYRPSLDLSPWIDSPRVTTSLERLHGECGDELRRVGFPAPSSGGTGCRCWLIGSRRTLWTGYTREQRGLLGTAARR